MLCLPVTIPPSRRLLIKHIPWRGRDRSWMRIASVRCQLRDSHQAAILALTSTKTHLGQCTVREASTSRREITTSTSSLRGTPISISRSHRGMSTRVRGLLDSQRSNRSSSILGTRFHSLPSRIHNSRTALVRGPAT